MQAPLGSNPSPKLTITNDDVTNYLAITSPGLMAMSPEMFTKSKQQLQSEADAGRLTKEALAAYAKTKAELPKRDFSDW